MRKGIGFALLIVIMATMAACATDPTGPVTTGTVTTAPGAPATPQPSKPNPDQTAVPPAPQQTAVPTAQPGLTPVATTPVPGGSSTLCNTIPTDLEALPRYTVDLAPLGQWFHPVFDVPRFQDSKGFNGQWSWFHSLCLIEKQGGTFENFNGQDAHFRFRDSEAQTRTSFAVLTTSQWRNQFMQAKANFGSFMNVRAIPGTTVDIFDPRTGASIGSKAVSYGGDLLIMEPANGIYGVRFPLTDPAKSFEAIMNFGPDDRPNADINRFDATKLTR